MTYSKVTRINKTGRSPATTQTVDEEWEIIQAAMIKVAEQFLEAKEQREKKSGST